MSGETEDMPGVQDFIIFLENVVRADIEIEDNEDEFDSQGALKKATVRKTTRDKETFFREKYGKAGNNSKTVEPMLSSVSKFSLSRIEWLDTFTK